MTDRVLANKISRDSVRGLTTAASVWVIAAFGCAAGAGLPVLAVAATAAYLTVVAVVFPAAGRRLPQSATAVSSLQIRYLDGRGALRRLLQVTTAQGFTIEELSADTAARHSGRRPETPDGAPTVLVTLQDHGRQPVNDLAATLSDIQAVRGVVVRDANAVAE